MCSRFRFCAARGCCAKPDERIDAERVAWLRTMIGDYERMLKLAKSIADGVEMPSHASGAWWSIEAMRELARTADPDPDATATMLREMWGMLRGLEKIHCQDVPEVAGDADEDLPL